MRYARVNTLGALPKSLAAAVADLPHYNGDPLTTEGPHRAVWRLTGVALAGGGASGATYYVTRWETGGSVVFAAAVLTPGGGLTLHAADWHPASYRTREAAEKHATDLVGYDVARASAADVERVCAELTASTR